MSKSSILNFLSTSYRPGRCNIKIFHDYQDLKTYIYRSHVIVQDRFEREGRVHNSWEDGPRRGLASIICDVYHLNRDITRFYEYNSRNNQYYKINLSYNDNNKFTFYNNTRSFPIKIREEMTWNV